MERKLLALGLMVALIISMVCTGCGSGNEKINSDLPIIGIVQCTEHPSLDTIRENIISELAAQGYVDGETITIDYKNGQGDTNNLKTICQSFVAEECAMIIAIATPAAQAAASETKDIPVIFSAVSDPISAQLVESMEVPGANVTGTSDLISAGEIMGLAKKIVPEMKTVGVIYSSAETNSLSVVEDLNEYAKHNNLKVVEKQIMNTSELQQAAQSLEGKVDIAFSPIDNNVASAISAAVNVFNDIDMPYFVSADSMVADGGLATYGISYDELGKETGDMAAKVLEGASTTDMPVRTMSNMKIYVNENTAKEIGIKMPKEILDKAIILGNK